MQEEHRSVGKSVESAVALALLVSIIALGILMARSNVRSKRGDVRGAARLGLSAFSLMWTSRFLYAHHTPTHSELDTFWIATGWALIVGAISWLVYIALEPYVRRRWPNSLISWSRLLSGQIRDPVVGRDLLVGILAGISFHILLMVQDLVPEWMGKTPRPPDSDATYSMLSGLRLMTVELLLTIVALVFVSLALFFIFFLIRLALRKEWLAAAVTIVILSFPALFADQAAIQTAVTVIFFSVMLLILIRFGLFSLVAALCSQQTLQNYPLTMHLWAWYAEPTFFVFAIILAPAIFGFYTSRAGKPVFGGISFDT